jgi:hypothetical protein
MNRFSYGIIAGALLALGLSHVFKEQAQITPKDLFQAYEKGVKDSLDAERPSEKLEAVCAALWLKGGRHDR